MVRPHRTISVMIGRHPNQELPIVRLRTNHNCDCVTIIPYILMKTIKQQT